MDAFFEIGMIFAIATVVALIMQRARLPLLLGHILTGFIVGPVLLNVFHAEDAATLFSQMGITALLFIVGLELNPNVIREVGRVALLTGIGQIIGTTVIGYLVSYGLGFSSINAFFLAFALTFSSTILVTKLLTDRGEATALYGKISIGFLLVQDLVAVGALVLFSSAQASFGATQEVALLFTKLAALALVLWFVATKLLPRFMHLFAGSQEFLFLFSAGWGMGWAALFHAVGLSAEIGALAAGVMLAASPYRYEVRAKMRLIRDFFIILFFVLLGSRLTVESVQTQWVQALVLSIFVLIVDPLIVIILMGWMRYSRKTSFFAGLTVGQISEFSLLFIVLVATKGYVDTSLVTLVTLIGIITLTASTLLITHADRLYHQFRSWLGIFERSFPVRERVRKTKYATMLFGCSRLGADFLPTLKKGNVPFLVIDFDPEVINELRRKHIPCRYGDAHDDMFLEEIGLAYANLVISTVPEFEVNMLILQRAKSMNPRALVIVNAERVEQARRLYAHGAAYVIMPHFLGGNHAALLLEHHGRSHKRFAVEREKHLAHLEKRFATG